MFHLLPRLQAAQEQREALGVDGADLNKITSFAALLPEPMLNAEGQAQFSLKQPRLDQSLPPFFIERTLARIERESLRPFEAQTGGLLTAAEKRAALLASAVDSLLHSLSGADQAFCAPGKGLAAPLKRNDPEHPSSQETLRRATRLDLFGAALRHAGPIARLLETHLLDPVRQDTLVEDDPFVQTTLYVVAPLFEPLSAALIWPLVTQLMARVGHQHVSQVIGLLGAGSYATDTTRSVEDAAAFAALAELEMLTGTGNGARHELNPRPMICNTVEELAPQLTEYIGKPLFDYIYLLDREKSNQGLAQNSHELAIVAANALEALSIAGGNLFIQEQLGLGPYTGDGRPYSLIGATCDYVPLAQVFHAVNRQEESRLVREWVLRNTTEAQSPPPGSQPDLHRRDAKGMSNGRPVDEGAVEAPTSDLAQLHSGVRLNGLEEAGVAQAALRLPGVLTGPSPATVDELDINPTFVLPRPLAVNLRRTQAAQWGKAFQDHIDELSEYIQLAVGPDAMGEALGTQSISPGKEWFLHDADERPLPSTVTRMQEHLLDDLANSPTGLTRAQNQVRRWLYEIDQNRQRLRSAATPNARQLARVQRALALRNWEANYAQAAAAAPSGYRIFIRTLIAIVVVALISLVYLLFTQRTWNYVEDGLSLLGFAVGISIVGLLGYRVAHARIRQLRRERVVLAQAELRSQLQEYVADSIVAGYDRLSEVLNHWSQMLAEAATELSALSTPPLMPAVPPPGVPLIKLYQPHLNQALWDRCLNFLRTQQDAQGQLSEERLDRIWGTPTWRNEMRRILSGSGSPSGQTQARTIAQFIRDTVRQSVAPVSIEHPNTVRAELIRELAKEFSIEHLLWRTDQEEIEIQRRLRLLEPVGNHPSTREKPVLITNRRYVENAWNRAKPTGNYDVADRLAVYGTVIDFATASGAADSDLTRALLEEFNVTLLPTDNPFAVTFVRSVHGLSLQDLDAIRRYRDELAYLTPEERTLVLLSDNIHDSLYHMERRIVQRTPTPLSYSIRMAP